MTRDPTTAEPETPPEPVSRSGKGRVWELGDRSLDADRPRVMGILNLTPDSFSDGGALPTLDRALERAEALVSAGADILDVGGESTRPGAGEIPVDEETDRILPFIREAADRFEVPVSVDTRKAEVARRAAEVGATIVNDVSGLTHDPEMAPFVAEAGIGVVLMHMRGTPETMQYRAEYRDVTGEVVEELLERVEVARDAGIQDSRIVLDPGIGFAKTADQSLTVLRDVHRIVELGFPVLVGPSRKSFLGAVLGVPAENRLEGTLAACASAYAGGARIFRVHDVGPAVRLLRVLEAVRRGRVGDGGPDEGGRPEGGAP
ncbi:MAG: dihydropteroate synthase [Longimicrobiales bacterium]|nr:dihydropteroate synthase [Longimicrobiales bacterium]